jgi:hypothetical protein
MAHAYRCCRSDIFTNYKIQTTNDTASMSDNPIFTVAAQGKIGDGNRLLHTSSAIPALRVLSKTGCSRLR